MKRVLVTGASGFVGQALCPVLERAGWSVRRGVRHDDGGHNAVAVGEIGPATDWSAALEGMDCLVHLAARVHVMKDDAKNPLEEFRRVNVAGTERLAREAARHGARRFIYLSSIKVNGERTPDPSSERPHPAPLPQGESGIVPLSLREGSRNGGRGARAAFTESDVPNPQDPYGVSKWEAEQALRRIEMETGLEVVVLRPPLVYGPGVKGNFLRLLQLADRQAPMPLASVRNRRSLVYLGNLADALAQCATYPGLGGQTFLVSDGEDVSTAELTRLLADAMGKPARLFPCPPSLLRLAGALAGRSDEVARLLDSLVVDGAKIRRTLGWNPPFSLRQGLAETASWYHAIK